MWEFSWRQGFFFKKKMEEKPEKVGTNGYGFGEVTGGGLDGTMTLFSWKIICKIDIVSLSFVFDKYF